MPFVEGSTVRTLLDQRSHLSLDEAVAITVDVAGALEYAHQRGIIHRDIKPENILIEEGQAVVSDFGIARARDAAASSTLTAEHMIGTPRYMSPEQLLPGRRWMPAAMYTHLACCSTRCSRANHRSPVPALSFPRSGGHPDPCAASGGFVPRWLAPSSGHSTGHWPGIRRNVLPA